MRVMVTSDTHGRHRELELDGIDLLLHCGDVSNAGTPRELLAFLGWVEEVERQGTRVLATPGNHDRCLDPGIWGDEHLLDRSPCFHVDRTLDLAQVHPSFSGRIHLSPWTPTFGYGWGYNADRGEAIRRYWRAIPDELDVLLTHGPPRGVLDRTFLGVDAGCGELAEVVAQRRPRWHCFGHIHEAYGIHRGERTTFVNCSLEGGGAPLVFDVPGQDWAQARVLSPASWS